jgi:hypothetical protein
MEDLLEEVDTMLGRLAGAVRRGMVGELESMAMPPESFISGGR